MHIVLQWQALATKVKSGMRHRYLACLLLEVINVAGLYSSFYSILTCASGEKRKLDMIMLDKANNQWYSI